MFVQSTAQKSKEFTIRTFSNDKALVKERRNHIVRCSTKVFTKKGYDRTNMRELAKACDMSAGALYHYFGSKEEILYSIINSATSKQAGSMEDCANELAKASPTIALVEIMRKFYEWHDENQNMTLFAYQETKNLPGNARQSIFDSEARILTVFEKLLTRGVEEGEFNIDDPKLIAHDIVVLGHAWALRRWYLRKRWTFKTYVEKQTDAMLRTITVDKNTGAANKQRKESSK
ncbi:MAG TPA: TetR/AcrR family transcriptional regulator [Dehalococcoidia bacterium]|nr:TetR/AcrR family transcriptional regulator [Dehalococcoidia bacterium]